MLPWRRSDGPCFCVEKRKQSGEKRSQGAEKRKLGAEKRNCTLGPPYVIVHGHSHMQYLFSS